MNLKLSLRDRLRLRRTAYTARGATLRKHCLWILLIDSGIAIAKLARFSGVSRPTIYRYAKIWLETHDPESLRSAKSGMRLARARALEQEKSERAEIDQSQNEIHH